MNTYPGSNGRHLQREVLQLPSGMIATVHVDYGQAWCPHCDQATAKVAAPVNKTAWCCSCGSRYGLQAEDRPEGVLVRCYPLP